MANVVVTSTTERIDVVFNAFASAAGYDKGSWRKSAIVSVRQRASSGTVQILIHTGPGVVENWDVAYAASGTCMVIDSIDGVPPASNSDLCDKLAALVKS